MDTAHPAGVTAFSDFRRIASGPLGAVAVAAKACMDRGDTGDVLVFDDTTGALIEVDLRGTAAEVAARIGAVPTAPAPEPSTVAGETTDPPARGRGRPRLGVVAREVTLLPRHWDWLATQPGGPSVALRKLVETARHANEGRDALRQRQEAVYRFAVAMAGNEPGFEEALRALYAADGRRFGAIVATWPGDIGSHANRLAQPCFAQAVSPAEVAA